MMITLCIDTSTERGMVVLAENERVLGSEVWRSTQGHAERLLESVEVVLGEAGRAKKDITHVGACVGPGGFTAVRVGLSTAKGLAMGLNIPICGVLSLRLLARAAELVGTVVPVINAYRGDVYAAAYKTENDTLEEVCAPIHGAPRDVVQHISSVADESDATLVGEIAVSTLSSLVPAWKTAPEVNISPDALAREVHDRFSVHGPDDLINLEPRYLRDSDAKLPNQPLRV